MNGYCLFMPHADSLSAGASASKYGDERSVGHRLYDACPAACDRLEVFEWEWVREHDFGPGTKPGRLAGEEWVEAKSKPVSCARGVNEEGLVEAAEEVARWVQAELHARGDEPLEDAHELWYLRLGYQNALYYLDEEHDRLWKEVEARVSPDGQPRGICVGSNQPIPVQVLISGKTTEQVMHGYPGCHEPSSKSPTAAAGRCRAGVSMPAEEVEREEQSDLRLPEAMVGDAGRANRDLATPQESDTADPLSNLSPRRRFPQRPPLLQSHVAPGGLEDQERNDRMNQWEYKVITLSDTDPGSLESKLNELGVEGWEVVAYVGHEQLDSIVLKCQKQHEVDEES